MASTQYGYQLSGLGGSVGHMQGTTLDDIPYAYNSPASQKANLNKNHWTNAYDMRDVGLGAAGTLFVAYLGWMAWKKLYK